MMKINEDISKKLSERRNFIIISLFLVIATASVYWQVHDFDFVNFDDNIYVSNNQMVKKGLNLENIIWAFNPAKTDRAYWHPLTWLSHMLDCQLFGLNPGAHHLVNLTIHVFNVVLLFAALHLMTGAPWKSGFVAALFALHPINADSVAWIAERKNLLSTMFWMLTVLAYIRYARKPGALRYALVCISLAAGLLAKPMLVTLPCVLLLLDFWPMERFDRGQKKELRHPDISRKFPPASITRLVIEKLPLLVLSLLTICLSVYTLQTKTGIMDHGVSPMLLRVENAFVSYAAYLWKMIWPAKLAVFYPFPKSIPPWQPISAALFLCAVTGWVLLRAKKAPYLATGWLWYLGTLVPVIGLIQGGLWPALADRWAYVPLIGIFIMLAWGLPEIIPCGRFRKRMLTVAATVLICILWVATWIQAGYWKNSRTLFEHALRVTSGNYIAHNAMGDVQNHNGLPDEAIQHYLQAIHIKPNYEIAHNNLATVLFNIGRNDAAIDHYHKALRIKPDYAEAHFNLGNALYQEGQINDAVSHFLQAIALNNGLAAASVNLANIYYHQGQLDQAILIYQQVLQQTSENAEAHTNLANALQGKGKTDAAIAHYLQAIELDPNLPEPHNNLGAAFIIKNDIRRAISCFQDALKIKPDYANAQNNLQKALLLQHQSLRPGKLESP